MRLVATTTGEAVVLSFTGDEGPKSAVLFDHEAKNMTVPEAIQRLMVQLLPRRGKIEVEIVEPAVTELEIELDGDEDDEDLSLYEEVVESPYEYLKDRGII